jgi:hypothetical protein
LYGRPTANRLGISAHLLNCHAEKSVIHFSFGNTYNDLPLYELEKLSQYDLDSVRKVSSLIVNMPIKQASTTGYCNQHYNFHDTLTQLYQHVFVDIVSESHVLGDTFFPTEKTTRPMWLKKPFIVFASKNYLDYLHQMEFRTFSDFWSEEYDGFEGKDRFNKILKLIDSIALKSTDELEKMYWDMQYTLNHNYNLLLTQTYKKEITYIP